MWPFPKHIHFERKKGIKFLVWVNSCCSCAGNQQNGNGMVNKVVYIPSISLDWFPPSLMWSLLWSFVLQAILKLLFLLWGVRWDLFGALLELLRPSLFTWFPSVTPGWMDPLWTVDWLSPTCHDMLQDTTSMWSNTQGTVCGCLDIMLYTASVCSPEEQDCSWHQDLNI